MKRGDAMKYKDLTRYEKERFKSTHEKCAKCGNYINRKYDSIIFTKENKGLRKIYNYYHRDCFDVLADNHLYIRG